MSSVPLKENCCEMATGGGGGMFSTHINGSGGILPLSAVQIAALTLALIGLLLGFAAILTPSWQEVYAREIEQWVQSGLWLNCQTRPNGMHTCVYTFSSADLHFYTQPEMMNMRSPPFYSWQRTLLFVLLVAQFFAVLALLSLCLSFHSPTRRLSAIAFVVFMLLAALLHAGSAIAFAFLSQMVEYRFFHVSVSGIYEKHRGYSFYLELAAIAFMLFALVPAALHLLRTLQQTTTTVNRQPHQQYFKQQPQTLMPPMTMGQFGYRQPDDEDELTPQRTHSRIWDEERFAMRQLPPLPSAAYR